MARSGQSRAQANKAIRQDALREQLAAGGHVQHVLDISKQLNDLDSSLESIQVTRLKYAADIKLKIIDKYLASLKAVEMTGEDGKPLIPSQIKIVHE